MKISSKHLHSQTVKARELTFWKKVHVFHMSYVTCHMFFLGGRLESWFFIVVLFFFCVLLGFSLLRFCIYFWSLFSPGCSWFCLVLLQLTWTSCLVVFYIQPACSVRLARTDHTQYFLRNASWGNEIEFCIEIVFYERKDNKPIDLLYFFALIFQSPIYVRLEKSNF